MFLSRWNVFASILIGFKLYVCFICDASLALSLTLPLVANALPFLILIFPLFGSVLCRFYFRYFALLFFGNDRKRQCLSIVCAICSDVVRGDENLSIWYFLVFMNDDKTDDGDICQQWIAKDKKNKYQTPSPVHAHTNTCCGIGMRPIVCRVCGEYVRLPQFSAWQHLSLQHNKMPSFFFAFARFFVAAPKRQSTTSENCQFVRTQQTIGDENKSTTDAIHATKNRKIFSSFAFIRFVALFFVNWWIVWRVSWAFENWTKNISFHHFVCLRHLNDSVQRNWDACEHRLSRDFHSVVQSRFSLSSVCRGTNELREKCWMRKRNKVNGRMKWRKGTSNETEPKWIAKKCENETKSIETPNLRIDARKHRVLCMRQSLHVSPSCLVHSKISRRNILFVAGIFRMSRRPNVRVILPDVAACVTATTLFYFYFVFCMQDVCSFILFE